MHTQKFLTLFARFFRLKMGDFELSAFLRVILSNCEKHILEAKPNLFKGED